METAGADQLARIANASARDQILIAAQKGVKIGMEQTPDKVEALLDTVKTVGPLGIGFALIGGVAVGIHSGVPRATLDTDIAIVSSVDRAGFINAMTHSGFQLVGEYEHSINFRHASGEPVQFAIDPFFDAFIERAEMLEVQGTQIRIVCKEDLIAMKRRAASDSGRRKSKALRDQADIELLLGDVPDPDEGW